MMSPQEAADKLAAEIFASWEKRRGAPAGFKGGIILAAASIGYACDRRLWYGFRWAVARPVENGERLRRKARGEREQPILIDELRSIGIDARAIDPATGGKFSFHELDGHTGGSIDGFASRVAGGDSAPHLLALKTYDAKTWRKINTQGVKAGHPPHYDSVQYHLGLTGLTVALYIAVNADTDGLHIEFVPADGDRYARLLARADRVIYAPEPLPKISDDKGHFSCTTCPAISLCHGAAAPVTSCRTCIHSTPEPGGNRRWSCAKWGVDIPPQNQADGCSSHLFLPGLLANWGIAIDAGTDPDYVEYVSHDGVTFRNGPSGPSSYTSQELSVMVLELLADNGIADLRKTFGARVVHATSTISD